VAEPIQHHTVPAAYLAGFLAERETQLHVYSRDGKHFRGAPKSLSSRRHYHSIHRKDGTRDNTVEQILANDVEDSGIAGLRKLANLEDLSQDERATLCVYMAIQYLRTPHMRGNFEDTFARMLDHVTRERMRRSGSFAAELAAANNMEHRAAERLAERAKASYLSGKIKIEIKPEFSLLQVFQQSDVYAAAMANWNWEVLTSSRTNFITSDCPVHFADNRHIALVDSETVMHFPLTSKALLVMRFAEPEHILWEKLSMIIPRCYLSGFVVWHNHIESREAEKEEVDALNRITASMSCTTIYVGSDTDQFNEVLSQPSDNVQLKVSASGDTLRVDLVAGESDVR
jgi:Protein of unknown function (DUF4238)